MMWEIAFSNGNFRGVCPVIGRLRQLVCGVYRRCMVTVGFGSTVFHDQGVIRTVKRTAIVSTVPSRQTKKLSTFFKEENNNNG